ncbi:hypothetical protein OG373_34840 [Streptomyces avidinii]|uniref:hypothetical protein n=1 Tax=Streptomyces avidinii TaxID=1895 RepID=UPI00386C22CC|nr:hypothetical protein OG373_34840 [Streptomyces avidinii]
MIIIPGLIILGIAAPVGLLGVFGNAGAGHAISNGNFSILGYRATGSTGSLILTGIDDARTGIDDARAETGAR